ncbi:hypothetical protein OGAPHI_003637 [Ogataea philodendri]|uniref:Uncharacterized protein n=1 Tax=Ogataea philodendri TaxID=1378263 RepID=A0A9P8P435_9ASCO|nr:uncharacterized protein OGAPHI_003637 [Ogataea philodendri]KAH3665453.1 hypothetical protein OGAPHI_003637 [Ogataea philodendri]
MLRTFFTASVRSLKLADLSSFNSYSLFGSEADASFNSNEFENLMNTLNLRMMVWTVWPPTPMICLWKDSGTLNVSIVGSSSSKRPSPKTESIRSLQLISTMKLSSVKGSSLIETEDMFMILMILPFFLPEMKSFSLLESSIW